MHEIDWYVIQRMLIDAPTYESDNDDDEETEKKPKKKKEVVVNLTDQNAGELLKQIL